MDMSAAKVNTAAAPLCLQKLVSYFDFTMVDKFALDPWLMLIRAGLAEHGL